MLGVWLEEQQLSVRADLPPPAAAAGEAVVRVLYAGICGTDLQLLHGYLPFRGIPGHEFVGAIEEGPPEWLGQIVVGEINLGCGVCKACRRGAERHCLSRRVLGLRDKHGAFAELLTLPPRHLHRLPSSIDLRHATLVEPLAAALRFHEQIPVRRLQRTEPILVVGDGRLGQLVTRSLILRGARVHVVGRSPRKLSMLARFGAQTADSDSEVTSSEYSLVVECSGSPGGFETARGAVRAGGHLILKSTFPGTVPVDLASLVVREVRVIGSRCGAFPPAIEMIAHGELCLDELIEECFPLLDAPAAFALAARPESLKVLLRPPPAE